jgi:hypothetical protein
MEFENMPESTNVEDRRGAVGGPQLGAGSGGLGLGAIVVLALIGYFTGIDPRLLIGGAEILTGGSSAPVQAPVANVGQRPATAQNDPMRVFVERVLGGTEAVWAQILPAQKGVPYTNATLVLYDGATASGCGGAQAAMGPFYCPLDKKVYLDLSFFRDMQTKYGGGGDFAYAYVIAQANALSVRVELMADCLAGVWAANANQKWKILDPGDIEKAMATAAAIGDDRLQTAARGYAVPDSFTHGSSAMRQKWLTIGLQSGQVDSCNTFAQ